MHVPVWIPLLLCACTDRPALTNVPRPNPTYAAGAAAAVAGAATLASPDAAGKAAAEANRPDPSNKPKKSGGTVPAAVFDRLEVATRDAGSAPP